jgi:hypothetical protein
MAALWVQRKDPLGAIQLTTLNLCRRIGVEQAILSTSIKFMQLLWLEFVAGPGRKNSQISMNL